MIFFISKKENVKIMKMNIRKNVQFVDLNEMWLIIFQEKCIKRELIKKIISNKLAT